MTGRGEPIGVSGITGPVGTTVAGLVTVGIVAWLGRALSAAAGPLPIGFDGPGCAIGELPSGTGEPETAPAVPADAG